MVTVTMEAWSLMYVLGMYNTSSSSLHMREREGKYSFVRAKRALLVANVD